MSVGSKRDVGDERRADAEPDERSVDGEAAEQQRRHWIGRLLRDRARRGAAVDRRHGEARVGDDPIVRCGDHPGGSGVATPVLARVAAQPLVERRLA